MLHDPPIYRLPPELLSSIFLFGANYNYPYTDSPFLFSPDETYESPSCSFQITASQVCRRWRGISTSTPSLWSWIHFHKPAHLHRAKAFLARCAPRKPDLCSTSHLLDILITTVSRDEHEISPNNTLSDPDLEKIFRLIVPDTSRWRSFHLYVRDAPCKRVARHYLSTCGPAPNLVTLQLYHFENFITPDDLYLATYRPPVICFDNSVPAIKHVSLIGVNMPWRRREQDRKIRDNFKMDNLESIQLALHADSIRPPYRYWENMLRGSPDLQYLSLHYSGPKKHDSSDRATFWPPSPLSHFSSGEDAACARVISLPGLTHLSLTDLEDNKYVCDILERLLCENLATLRLGVMDDIEDDFTELLELIMGRKVDSASSRSSSPSSCLPSASPHPANGELSLNEFYSPVPNFHQLHTLILTTFICSFSSFQSLLYSLVGLKSLQLSFQRLQLMDETGAFPREAWEVFVENDDSCLPCSRPLATRFPEDRTGPAERATLLPNLVDFNIHDISGQHLVRIIDSRLRVINWRRRDHVTSKPLMITIPHYIIRYNDKTRANDPILDTVIREGGVWIRCLSSEDAEDNGAVEKPLFISVEVKSVPAETEDAEIEDEDDSDTESEE